jgi:hypothetical protein
MTTDRIALLRPINTAVYASAVTFGDTGGTHVHFGKAAGTYYSVLSLLDDIATAIIATWATATVTINSDYKVVFTFPQAEKITWADSELRNWLGFSGNQTAATTHTASYTPQHAWISTYAPSDQTDFYLPMGDVWSGTTALDGGIAGVQQYAMDSATNHCMGFVKDLTLHYESSASIFIGRCTDTSGYSIQRSLEWFMSKARSATVAGLGDPPATGFWFLWNADNMKITADWADMTAHNTVVTDTGTGLWQFCQPELNAFGKPISALPVGKARYNVNLRIHQAEYPGGML